MKLFFKFLYYLGLSFILIVFDALLLDLGYSKVNIINITPGWILLFFNTFVFMWYDLTINEKKK